jgi:hypothetical protein
MWLCIVSAVVSIALKFWLGAIFLISGYLYWYSVRWVDKNGGWK